MLLSLQTLAIKQHNAQPGEMVHRHAQNMNPPCGMAFHARRGSEDRMARVERTARRHGFLGKYAYAWLTLGFFGVSLVLHWVFGWQAFVQDSAQHGQPPVVADYTVLMLRDTFENWQSEFLQLLWQVVGLAYLLYIGSPSSKENDDRMEEKIDAILRKVEPREGARLIADIDDEYLRHGGHARPHGTRQRSR